VFWTAGTVKIIYQVTRHATWDKEFNEEEKKTLHQVRRTEAATITGTILMTKYVIKIINITPSLSNSPSAYFTCNGLDA